MVAGGRSSLPDTLSHLRLLEAESIHILREAAAEFSRPVMLYSIGKDSSCLLHLARKAFYPARVPFSLLHVDTTYEFRETTEFRDRARAELGLDPIVHVPAEADERGAQSRCAILRTKALVDALAAGGFDAAVGGARRDEEKSRAQERIYSFRDSQGQGDPRNQRPEPWDLCNGRLDKGESMRVFPLSNWTELDVWQYIHLERIPVAPLYFAREREMLVRGDLLIPFEHAPALAPGEQPRPVMCRMRSLGCTGAIRSTAATVPEIIDELRGWLSMEADLLRFTTAGGVGDGKSTLIGRLLHDAGAEGEPGTTTDVAYRYFSTPRRKFIVADAPGHEQYTRNMVTGASTAELAVMVLDARKGVLPQTRRHAAIAWLLGIRRMVAVVNKMDLAGYRREVFDRIRGDFEPFAARLAGCAIDFIPVSALAGDNVVRRGPRLLWFEGPSLLEYLETVSPGGNAPLDALRLPVQYVLRPPGDFRGYAGRLAAGSLRPGDQVLALPSGRTTRVRSLPAYDGDLERAGAPMSVAVCLEDDLDLSRGDLLVDPARPPVATRRLRATLVWMSETPLALGRPYLLQHTTQRVCAEVTRIASRLDLPALDDIVTVELETHRPLFVDPYEQNRTTGSFILIDLVTNQTLAAGMIDGEPPRRPPGSGGGPAGFTVWFTGLSSAGKTTLSRAVYDRLLARGCQVERLDGDDVRRHLCKDLGFSKRDRDENIRRIGFVAELLTRNGVIALVAAISPYRAVRDEVRARIGDFVEVFVNAPLETCEQRDCKGLYRKARAGQLPGFTGIDDPYEPPPTPEIECRTDRETLDESVEKVLGWLEMRLSR
jgi:bifunctional enzyme CysN/CysC